MTNQEEWDGIRRLFETYVHKLRYDAVEATAHFLAVGENELGFEYLILFLFENNVLLNSSYRQTVLDLGRHLKMYRNEWTDEKFWSKLTTLCDR